MNVLHNNPLGAALLGACGLFVLVGLGLTLIWSGTPDAGDPDAAGGDAAGLPAIVRVEALGPLEDYAVINERPLFNPSRRPVTITVAEAGELAEVEVDQEVADPPKVRLTGVVITPDERVVSLTPEAGGEALVIREGMPLEGEYVGWSVDAVEPREVRLRSANGERVNVELAVYDAMIAAPPEPEPRVAEDVTSEAGEPASEEARSRADEIRERIRQRREQLRAEAEEKAEAQEDRRASTQNAYQDAIRAMIRGGSGKNEEEEDESGEE